MCRSWSKLDRSRDEYIFRSTYLAEAYFKQALVYPNMPNNQKVVSPQLKVGIL